MLLAAVDSSFLFLPFGIDILIVLLIARHHDGFPWYVLAAVTGATIGVFFLDLVARRLGERGVQKMAGKKRFETLRKNVGSRAGVAILVGSLIPPPFPIKLVIATASALKYSRARLLIFNGFGRAIRFTILGVLAVEFGHAVITFVNSDAFKYTMYVFVFLCIVGSIFSIWNWIRHTRSAQKES